MPRSLRLPLFVGLLVWAGCATSTTILHADFEADRPGARPATALRPPGAELRFSEPENEEDLPGSAGSLFLVRGQFGGRENRTLAIGPFGGGAYAADFEGVHVAFLAASSPTPAEEVLFSWQGQMDHMTGAFAVVGETLSNRALAVHFANGHRGGGWGVARVLMEVAGTDGEREWEEVGRIREMVPYHTLIHVNPRTGTYSLLVTQRGHPRISVRDRRIPNLEGLDLARPVIFFVLDDSHEWAYSYHVDDVLIMRR